MTRHLGVRAAAIGVILLGAALVACGDEAKEGKHAQVRSVVPEEQAGAGGSQVTVYFLGNEGANYTEFRAYAPAARPSPGGGPTQRAEAAIRALQQGPNAEERARGMRPTYFPTEPSLVQSVTVDAGTMIVDFDEGIVEAARLKADDAGAGMLAPLMATAFAIDEVQVLELHGEGSCETYGEWATNEDLGPPVGCVRRTREEVDEWKAAPQSQQPDQPLTPPPPPLPGGPPVDTPPPSG